MIKYVLFDLDGTLTDPAEGITNSVAYALAKFGIEVKDKRELYKFIGPPLVPSFMEFYGFSEDDAKKALSYYREYFAPHGIFENEMYEGIPELLAELSAAGKKIILATSKPQEFAKKILEHFEIDGYFSTVCGNTLDESRPTKRDVIAYILQIYPDMTAKNSFMVGDRKYDVEGAHALGIPAVAVLYGYGDEAELSAAGADHTVSDVKNLKKLLHEL